MQGFIAATSWKRAGKRDAGIGAGDDGFAGFERLAQAVEHGGRELRQLVEEEHAVVGEADLAGPDAQTAADQCRHRGRMMRRAERPAIAERAAGQFTGDRLDHRDIEQFARIERRQDRGQPRREHRFAGAGRADHQQIVAAGRRDFEGAARDLLAADLAQVGQAGGIGAASRQRPRRRAGSRRDG